MRLRARGEKDALGPALAKGKPITMGDLSAAKQEEHKVIDIEDGDAGRGLSVALDAGVVKCARL